MRFSNDETFPKWEPVEGLEWDFETMSKIDRRELWVSWEEDLIHCLFKNSGVIQTSKFGEKTGGTIKRNVNNQIIIIIHKSFFDKTYILSTILGLMEARHRSSSLSSKVRLPQVLLR